MAEDFSKDNLGFRAKEYLHSIVCYDIDMCVEVKLKIVSSCIDATTSKACARSIASTFSRLEYSSSGSLHLSRPAKFDGDWWIEDLSVLRIDIFPRVLTAMKSHGDCPERIGASLGNYAAKELTQNPKFI